MGFFKDLFVRLNSSKNAKIIDDALKEKEQLFKDFFSQQEVNEVPEEVDVIKNPFTFNFTLSKFEQVMTVQNSEEWFEVLCSILPKFDINTPERVAGFLAQTGHESLNFSILEENLNYSARGLVNTFGSRFPSISYAKQYHRNPEKIANRVYSNRMGNGSPGSGDGWKFRGRGLIQCTGKYNYKSCSEFLFGDDTLLRTPDLVSDDRYIAVSSACWFWESNNINRYCDKKDIVGMTRKINGGTNGLKDREIRFQKALRILNYK